MKLGDNIRKFRKKRGLSQEDLAKALNYKSFTTIQKWETNISEPSLGKLHKIAELLDVTLDDLIENKVNITNNEHLDKIIELIKDLTPEEYKEVEKFILFLISNRDSK